MWACLPFIVRGFYLGLHLSETPTNPSSLFSPASTTGEKVPREGGLRGSQIKGLRVWWHLCHPALLSWESSPVPSLCYHSGEGDDSDSRQWNSLLVKEHSSGAVSWKRLLSGRVILTLTCLPFLPMIPSRPEVVAGAP